MSTKSPPFSSTTASPPPAPLRRDARLIVQRNSRPRSFFSALRVGSLVISNERSRSAASAGFRRAARRRPRAIRRAKPKRSRRSRHRRTRARRRIWRSQHDQRAVGGSARCPAPPCPHRSKPRPDRRGRQAPRARRATAASDTTIAPAGGAASSSARYVQTSSAKPPSRHSAIRCPFPRQRAEMNAAFGLAAPAPAPGALVLAGLDRAGAGQAADRGKALGDKRVAAAVPPRRYRRECRRRSSRPAD